MSREIANSQWIIASVNSPTAWIRHSVGSHDDEVWLLQPPRRYILNANNVKELSAHFSSVSDLKSSTYHRPLIANTSISGSRILIERHRDRGIGDLLFTTCPLEYLQHITGNSCRIHTYALAEKAQIFSNNPNLEHKAAFVGPLEYDVLPLYDYHWFIDTVTEYDEEREQLNVYDALYKQLGVDYRKVDARFKRPYLYLTEKDFQALDSLFFMAWEECKLDLRQEGYYVVAPFAASTLRSLNYKVWFETIQELAKIRPVVVIGAVNNRMPYMDMSANDFIGSLGHLAPRVLNLSGKMPLRTSIALIAKAKAMFCLDSGPLYIAQALRTPAISVWGTHHPGVRLGYDQAYMDLAVWNHNDCQHSPCYAYAGFPVKKCPPGEKQTICEILKSVTSAQLLKSVDKIEGNFSLSKPAE